MRIPDTLWSSQLGAPIAHGGSSTLYAFGQAHIVKFYDKSFDAGNAEREIRLAALARGCGARTPEVHPSLVRDVETGRIGVVMARLQGRAMGDDMVAAPWRIRWFGDLLATAMSELHGCVAGQGFDAQADWLASHIADASLIPEPTRDRLLRALAALPAGDRLCHGDLHPGNVFLDVEGATVLDWPNALSGNPTCDIARSWVIMRFPLSVDAVYRGYLRWLFLPAFLRACRRRVMDVSELQRWIIINAAARVGELERQFDMRYLSHWLQVRERRWMARA